MAFALVASGCGGSSSDTQATGASRPSATTSESATTTTASGVDKGSGKQKQQSASKSQKESAGGKHGPHVTLPQGPPEPEPTPKQEEESTFANMSVSSPGIDGGGTLSRTYTCDGKGTWPPIEWHGVPAGTRELAVFISNFAPVEGKIFFDWAAAGIDPESTGLESGTLPEAVVIGKNSEGRTRYSLCPESGGETYVLTVYALEKNANPKQGFDPAAFREKAQEASESAGVLTFTAGS